MYSLTRCSTPQQAAITSGIMKVVSMHEQDRDPVHAHLVGQAHASIPVIFHQLEAGVGRIELCQDEQRDEEGSRRRDEAPRALGP